MRKNAQHWLMIVSWLWLGINLHAAEGANLQGQISAGGLMQLTTDGHFQVQHNAQLNAAQMYLESTAGNLDQFGQLSADLMSLNAGGDLNNHGSLQADSGLWVSAGDRLINHSSGQMISGGVLSLTATNDLINRQGYLEGVNVSLTSKEGDIINRTEFDVIGDRSGTHSTRIGEASTIISHNSLSMDDVHGCTSVACAGCARATAGRNLDLQGSQFSAAGNISLNAGNDILLYAVEDSRAGRSEGKNYRLSYDITEWTGVSIAAGGDLSLTAGRDIQTQGTQLSAGGNASLHAERDLNLVAVNDSRYISSYQRTDRSFGRSRTTETESLQESVVGGVIQAGGNVLINARATEEGLITLNSGNVNILGGQVIAGEHLVIAADEDINVSASQVNELDYQQTTKSGFGGLSGKDMGSVEQNTLLNMALLQAGENGNGGSVNLLSGNNVALVGTQVVADGDINIEAVDQLLVSAGEVLLRSEQWKESSGLFTGGDIYATHESRAGEVVATTEASLLEAGGQVNIQAGSARIIGSDIHGEEGVNIVADIGDIEVLAAQTRVDSFSYDKSVTVGLGDLLASDPSQIIQNKDGRLTMTFADATYDEVDTQIQATEMRGSSITTGAGNIHFDAANDILIEGSHLAAGINPSTAEDAPESNITLVATNNVTIKEATDTYTEETKEIHGTAEMSMVVQHQAVEVVKAVEALDQAKDQLEQAQKDYKKYERDLDNLSATLAALEADYQNKVPGVNYEDILELREILGDMKGDKEWYVAGVVLAAANVTAKTTALVQQTAAAAQSTATWGFNAGVQLDIDASKTQTSLKETTAVASTLSGDNIRIQTGAGQASASGTTTTIQGSHLNASGEIDINTGELNILASRDTREFKNTTEQGHITAQMTVYGASGGASINADFSRSKEGDSSTTINNSTLTADSIRINTTDDTNIRGGNVHADTSLIANIGGDLNVESLQDRHRSNNNSVGFSAGLSGSGGTASGVNAGYNAANGMSITRETVLTSLTSGGTAEINVQGNTQITGALIATIDEDGNDLKQLTLNTGSLSFTDLTNIHQSSQTSGSISTSVGIGSTTGTQAAEGQELAKDAQGRPLNLNTSNITYSNTSQYDADKTLATLGGGTITVGGVVLEQDGELTDAGRAEGSALDRLNRDTTSTTKDLWSIERTEGNVDLAIDHRMFSEEGRRQIREDVKRTEILGEAIVDMGKESVSFFGAGEGESSVREHIGNTQNYFTATKNFVQDGKNADHIKALSDPNATPIQKEAAYHALINTIAHQMGVDPLEAKILIDSDPQFAGAYSRDTGTAYINDLAHNSAAQAVNTLGHETQHHLDHQKNPNAPQTEQYHENREEYASIMGNATEDYLKFNFAQSGDPLVLADSNNHFLGATPEERNSNIGIGVRNSISFGQENLDNVDFRPLNLPETQHLAEISDGITRMPLRPEVQQLQINNLTAEACARTQCANGIPTSDPNYVTLKDLEARGHELIANGQSQLGNEGELFAYGTLDQVQDFLRRNDKGIDKVEGVTQAAAGTYGAVASGGAAIATSPGCTTGVGCLPTIGLTAVAGVSADAAYDGWQKVLGDYHSPFGQEVYNNFSLGTYQDPSNPVLDLGVVIGTEIGLYGLGRFADTIADGVESSVRFFLPKAPTTPQWDNPVSGVDGDFGFLTHPVRQPITDPARLLEHRGLGDPNYRAPEAPEYPIIAYPAAPGTRINMAVAEGQINPNTGQVHSPGGHATQNPITSMEQVEIDFAVKPEWGPPKTHVQEFEVRPGTRLQDSVVGPQVDAQGRIYPGGEMQTEVLVPRDQRNNVLTPIGPARPLPEKRVENDE